MVQTPCAPKSEEASSDIMVPPSDGVFVISWSFLFGVYVWEVKYSTHGVKCVVPVVDSTTRAWLSTLEIVCLTDEKPLVPSVGCICQGK